MKKFNEKKYTTALKTLAEQIVAMAKEDEEPDEESGDLLCRAEEYAATAYVDIEDTMIDLVK